MKTCCRCKKEKPESAYHKDRGNPGGLHYMCRDCRSEKYYEDHENNLRMTRQYYSKNVDRQIERVRNYRERHKKRAAAFVAVSSKTRTGRIKKPGICSQCGSGGIIHAHHEDYNKPLEVEWLCQKCHKKLHREKRSVA